MQLRVLGCSGAEFPGHHPSAFLIDDSLLLDAGTIGAVLTEEEQLRIRDILVTHPHLDHIRGIPLLADNVILKGLPEGLNLISTCEIIAAIRAHLLNGVIWPDFTKIPSAENPVLSCTDILPEKEFRLGAFTVTAFKVNHTVPAVAYRITKNATTLLYTGDTGPTDRIWEMAGDVSALLVEVSFPDAMEELALITGHLTPFLLTKELAKLGRLPPRILITHLKPQYFEQIREQLEAAVPGAELLQDGRVYNL
ncbi:MAG: MBL fold metallo-hydrolase [Geobacteraceae bacterium GWC2_58_44]|nr:MAG: MBL fold metallo-hydrolase [Geobacteraceae bacterium GWC2_58_44]HBG05515.1 MBL fold metallo-hydrolase [Geobacter sp.]